MPYGIGCAGWHTWPYLPWGRCLHPWFEMAAWSPFWSFSSEDEIDFLEGQAKLLENELAQVKKRLNELK